MRPVLRALSGSHPGAAFAIRDRTTLGRAALADIQLVDESVSRFHALIERQTDGRHAIADLDSKAGIVVDGTPVRRATLDTGTVVEICGFTLRYEWVDDDVQLGRVPKVNGFVAVRQTNRVAQMDAPAAASDAAPSDKQIVVEQRPTGAYGAQPAAPAAAQPEVRPVTSPDAEWLVLLRDVVQARELREAGETESPLARALADRFAEPPIPFSRRRSRRGSRRHACRTPVLIGMRRGAEVVTTVGFLIDVSLDGGRVCTEEALPAGTQCWLLVATGDSERGGIAFSTSVRWSDSASGHAGLGFIGRAVAGDVLPALHTR